MVEKRKSKRIPVELSLSVSKLFKQEAIEELSTATPITVTDISRGGIGFESEGDFPLNYYFNAKLELGSAENSLYCVVQVIRKQETESGYAYGCIFVGMSSVLNYIFEDFEKMSE